MALITLTVSHDNDPQSVSGGSVLYVDDLAFIGTTGINDLAAIAAKTLVWSNSGTDEVSFEILSTNSNEAQLKVYDIIGKIIEEVIVVNEVTKIPTVSHPSGIYFIN